MTPYDCYVTFLALKQHFTKPKYDVIKYNWKTRASLTAFHKRTDRYFYERLSRKKNDQEVKDFFISNFVSTDNPNSVYIADLMKEGEDNYLQWMKRIQSLSYTFKTEISDLLFDENLNSLLTPQDGQHSNLIRKHLQKSASIETLVILQKILHYVKDYDKIFKDPVWDSLRLKIVKYEPLLNIEVDNYSNILKEIICE